MSMNMYDLLHGSFLSTSFAHTARKTLSVKYILMY